MKIAQLGLLTLVLPSLLVGCRPADVDDDGVDDVIDNCVDVANDDQADLDEDGVGDVCDDDRDGDGTANADDAFPDDAAESADTDGDGVGDNADAFPSDPSETIDTDGDGVGDNGDNCVDVANADQADADGDGLGDSCDGDRDGDGTADADDAFPDDPTETTDTDGDGVGDNADAFPSDPSETTDTDGDGVGDNGDNCADVANADQADLDTDGLGDVCDDDLDGDGTSNAADAFPSDPMETADTDGDGVGDNADNCPTASNADQADLDTDGLGDACDTDADGDGFDAGLDCDDTLAAVNPDAPETCDGVDNNCSGTIDDGVAVGSAQSCAASSCADVLAANAAATDGAYWLNPDSGSAFEAACDMTNGGWTLVLGIDGSSTMFGNNSPEWSTAGESGSLPTGDFAAADYRGPAYDRLANNEVRLCFADYSACHVFPHAMNRSLMSFFTDGVTYAEYSFNSRNIPDVGTVDSWNQAAGELGITPDNSPCRWMGINDMQSISAIGLLGDYNGGCQNISGTVPYHDDIALGVGLQSCADTNGCNNGGSGHTAGRVRGVGTTTGDVGPWFVFVR